MMPMLSTAWAVMLSALAPAAGPATAQRPVPAWPAVEFAFEIWDWVPDYRDFNRFRARIDQARRAGFNTIEISVPWKDVQPTRQGPYEWARTDRRIEHVLSYGLALRVRINFSYAHPWPKWVRPELATRHDGRTPQGFMTVFDADLNRLHDAAAQAIAARYRGWNIEWAPVFGMHTEVKFGDWLGYEPAGKAAFRAWLRGQHGSLANLCEVWGRRFDAWQDVEPPVPRPTKGEPDLSPPVIDWIAFREQALADKMARLLSAVRRGDPSARTAVMLGESYRRGAASMANLAYWRYSRGADRVLHSYDFFWHGPKDRRAAGVATDIMRGVTGKPVVFEIDGPILFDKFGYTDDDLVAIGRMALDHGAVGLNVANFCYTDKPLSAFGFLARLGRAVARLNAERRPPALSSKRWYYVSKWANYVYREPTEWVHERQFDGYLRRTGRPDRPRIVTDENLLHDDATGVEEIHIAPPLVIDERVARRIEALSERIRVTPADPFEQTIRIRPPAMPMRPCGRAHPQTRPAT